MKASLAALVVVAAFTGCSLVGSPRDLVVYSPELPSGPPVAVHQAPHRWQLTVSQPLAIAPFDGQRVVVMPAPLEIRFYKDVRWRDSGPALVQELLLQALQNSGAGGNVARPSAGIRSDFDLQSELHAFQAEYAREQHLPTVKVAISFHLVRSSTRAVVASRTFVSEKPCSSEKVNDVVEGFQQALGDALGSAAAWVIAEADDPR